VTFALEFDRVSRRFDRATGAALDALVDVTAAIEPGRTVAVIGRSGSGKSTLLHLAAGIDRPTSGTVRVFGRDLAALSDRERTLLRRDTIGLVFQFFHLLPHLSVAENVALPGLIAGKSAAAIRARAAELLERVGLAGRAADPVERLSGGEQQRVALCRALLLRPRLILADEPTGSLDDDSAAAVLDLLHGLVRAEGATLVTVTHDPGVAARADFAWRLHSGVLECA
jgi:ABC-type lipoprotein export system ATPase subunit